MNEDAEIREALVAIDDNESIDVTDWEAKFIDSVAFKTFPLSEKQREVANKIIAKYEK